MNIDLVGDHDEATIERVAAFNQKLDAVRNAHPLSKLTAAEKGAQITIQATLQDDGSAKFLVRVDTVYPVNDLEAPDEFKQAWLNRDVESLEDAIARLLGTVFTCNEVFGMLEQFKKDEAFAHAPSSYTTKQ